MGALELIGEKKGLDYLDEVYTYLSDISLFKKGVKKGQLVRLKIKDIDAISTTIYCVLYLGETDAGRDFTLKEVDIKDWLMGNQDQINIIFTELFNSLTWLNPKEVEEVEQQEEEDPDEAKKKKKQLSETSEG